MHHVKVLLLTSASTLATLLAVTNGCVIVAEGEGEGEGEGEEGEGEGEGEEGEGEGEGEEGEGEGEAPFDCTSGTVFAGFPEFDSDQFDRALEGDPLAGVQGQPMLWRTVVFLDDHIITHNGQELWASDLSVANPTVTRIVGVEDTEGQSLNDGPCGDARFANLHHMVVDSEGSIFVVDQTANAVLKIENPLDDATCTVSYFAGTAVDTVDITPDTPPNVGDRNGPGLQAQFGLPARIAIDSDDNLYIWDEGNGAIKKIANDVDHTVSELTTDDGNLIDAMLVLDDVLYVYAHSAASEVSIISVDLTTGAKADIIRGNVDLFGFSGVAIQPGGMTTDGTDLFIYFRGLLFSVTLDGVLTRIAGDDSVRSTIEYEGGFDPFAVTPADDMQFPNRDQFATAGTGSWLSIDENDDLYFIGSLLDAYVVKVDCGR